MKRFLSFVGILGVLVLGMGKVRGETRWDMQ